MVRPTESVGITPQLNILNPLLAFDSPRYLGAAAAVSFLHHFPGGHPSKHYSRPSTLNCPLFGLARISRPGFGRIVPVRGARPWSRLAQGPLAGPGRQKRHAWAPPQRTVAGSQADGGEEHAKGAEFVFTSPEEAVRQRKGLPGSPPAFRGESVGARACISPPQNSSGWTGGGRSKKGCNTRTSQEVTHPSTTLAQARFTAEF